MSMFARIADAHRRTRKPRDIVWNRFVARPLASVLLIPLEWSRVTPNQITFGSLVVFAIAAIILLALPGHGGLLLAVAVAELSYVLDCADGQLARLRGSSSVVGAHLDFLMDEIKAFLIVGAAAFRLWRETGSPAWLVAGLAGLCAVASAVCLTTFVRGAAYVAATGARPSRSAGDYGDGFEMPPESAPAAPSPIRRLAASAEAVGRYLIHYPSYLPYVAITNRLDVFLVAYIAVNTAYAARTLLAIVDNLGRPARAPNAETRVEGGQRDPAGGAGHS